MFPVPMRHPCVVSPPDDRGGHFVLLFGRRTLGREARRDRHEARLRARPADQAAGVRVGYGCVTSHLKKHAGWDVTSCDIYTEAIDFLDRQIGVKTLQRAHLPEQFATIEKYDVVFALSFFLHLPGIVPNRHSSELTLFSSGRMTRHEDFRRGTPGRTALTGAPFARQSVKFVHDAPPGTLGRCHIRLTDVFWRPE